MTAPGITGIILAGGESRRMGTFKPMVQYRGKPLINWVFDALQPLCSEMIIVANSGDFTGLPARLYPDNFPGQGPAAGIESGLSHCRTPLALISSCDTPNLPAGLFSFLLRSHGGYDISLVAHDGINEPLIGCFSQSVHAVFLNALLSGNSHPPRIIRQCKWHEVEVKPGSDFYKPDLFLNLNTPPDLTS
jgi:molybdopterin-guanine dinucleotide biosynthesis protein A